MAINIAMVWVIAPTIAIIAERFATIMGIIEAASILVAMALAESKLCRENARRNNQNNNCEPHIIALTKARYASTL
jgi:hypothetical protein